MWLLTTKVDAPNSLKVETCNTCGALCEYYQTVKVTSMLGNFNRYYCQTHKKPYHLASENLPYDIGRYWQEIEVDAEGVPIGYKKK